VLDKDLVFKYFLTFSGLDEDAGCRMRPVCDAAAGAISARLSEKAEFPRDMERLCLAAAAVAYSGYLEIGSADSSMQEIKVGDISLRDSAASGSSAKGAADLRDSFLAGVAPLLKAPFVFRQVAP